MTLPKKQMETLKEVVYVIGCLGAFCGYAIGLYTSVYNHGADRASELLEPRLRVIETRLTDIQDNVTILMRRETKIDKTSTETNLVLRNK